MNIISASELNTVLVEAINKIKEADTVCFNTCNFLYTTGCRFSELNLDRWSQDEEGNFIVQPSKRNLERTFSPDELPEHFRNCFEAGNLFLYDRSSTTMERLIPRMLWPYDYFVGKQRLITHIFRHNRFKQLYKVLQSREAVHTKMGEKRESSTLHYIFSEIKQVRSKDLTQ